MKQGQITNADLYLTSFELNEAAQSLLDLKGKVLEFDPGELGHEEIEHATLGSVGKAKLPGRPVQPIEGKISFEWIDQEIERIILNPTKRVNVQLHQYVDIFVDGTLNEDDSHTLVYHVGFNLMKSGGKAAKLGDMVGREHDISITKYIEKVYGAANPIVEFDYFNNIYNVNGEPVWSV